MTDSEFNHILSSLSGCFLQHDFDLWRSIVRLPLTIITEAGHIILRSELDLAVNFTYCKASAEAQGLDAIRRFAISKEHVTESVVLGTFETHLLCNEQYVVEPYVSEALFRREDENFRLSFLRNALGHRKWSGLPPSVEREMVSQANKIASGLGGAGLQPSFN